MSTDKLVQSTRMPLTIEIKRPLSAMRSNLKTWGGPWPPNALHLAFKVAQQPIFPDSSVLAGLFAFG